MPCFYSIFHIIILRTPPKNDATVSTNPSHFSGHFYHFISPSEPRRTSTSHIRESARQVPHSRVEPRFLSLDPRKISPVAFLLSIHEGPSTRMERNMPRRLPQFIWSFYDFIQAIHDRRSQLRKLAPSCRFLWNVSNSDAPGFPHPF